MGLFGSKTKWYVASQIYNLAGDNLSERLPYMKSLVIQSALMGGDMATNISRGIQNGPGFQLKKFHRWANLNYEMGLPSADIVGDTVSSLNTLAGQIPIPSGSPAGTFVVPVSAVITQPDTQIWAEKHLIENRPDLINKVWTVDQDDFNDRITISFADSTPDIVFTPSPWTSGARYIAARYALSYPAITGPRLALGRKGPFRDIGAVGLTGFSAYETLPPIQNSFTLTRKVTVRRTYTDGTPSYNDVVETSQVVHPETVRVNYRRTTNRGFLPGTERPNILVEEKEVLRGHEKLVRFTREIINESNYIEINTIEEEYLADAIFYDDFQRDNQGAELSRHRVFLYRLGGSNPVLNNIEVNKGRLNEFLPMLPLRIDNKFVTEAPWKDTPTEEAVTKAYKKSYNDDISKFIEELDNNENIDDIDFAFLIFGITLNEKDPVGKKYIYEFLKTLMSYQESTKSQFDGYYTYLRAQEEYRKAYDKWRMDMNEPQRVRVNNTRTPPERPTVPQYPPPVTSSFILDANIPNMPWYSVTFKWTYIDESVHAGFGKPGAKPGDVWWTLAPAPAIRGGNIGTVNNDTREQYQYMESRESYDSRKIAYLYHQIDKFNYRRLEIAGFSHSNYVYKNKSVVAQLYDEIEEMNEEESPVFFPIHYPTLKDMTLKEQNQIGGCSRLLLLNSYEKVKVKWYERGIFKIFFVVAIVIVGVLTFGGGLAGLQALPGVFGAAGQVGVALGFASGTMAAAVAGAALNMMAATILSSVIMAGATELFGAKWGQIIGTIASFFAMQLGASYTPSGGFNLNWGSMFNADNLINLSSAMAKGYAGFMQVKTMELQEDYETMAKEYKDQMREIEERTMELLGQSAWIDPMMLTELGKELYSDPRESSESFLSRTLLTGNDIVELSLAAISEFPRASLEIPEAII